MKNNTKFTALKIVCRKNDLNTLDFFLVNSKSKSFYLFTTKYFSKTVFAEYVNGKKFDSVYTGTRKFRQQKLKDRILRLSDYIIQENGLSQSISKRKTISHTKHHHQITAAEAA